MPSNYLDDDADRIVRYVPWSKLRKNEEETVVYGPLGSAFALRKDEEYLSVTWCEYHSGSDDESLRCAVEKIRCSDLRVGGKARFAVARAAAVRKCAENIGKRVRIIHEAEADNPAHVAVRNWPSMDNEFLELIAEEVWADNFSNVEIDALPASPCNVSERGGR